MQSEPAIWVRVVRCAALAGAALALHCGLDNRRITPPDGGETMASDGSTPEMDGGGGTGGDDTNGGRGGAPVGGGGSGGDEPSAGQSGGGSGGGEPPPPDAGETDHDTGTEEDSGPPPDAACTAGNELHLQQGWVDGSTNCVGIQGGVRADGRPESLFIVTLDTLKLCAEGSSNETDRTVFDVSIALLLNEPQRFSGGPGEDYNAEAHGVVGFEFVIEPITPLSYFGVISDGTLYCAPITGLGAYRFALTDLHAECWNGDSGPTPHPRRLRSIGFYSDTGTETDSFQFCVTDIVALTSLD